MIKAINTWEVFPTQSGFYALKITKIRIVEDNKIIIYTNCPHENSLAVEN